ncbi:hypothetical protein ACFU1R_29465 [Priestia megaterium]|uniref:hypothetical protein n=1 Tax=Priestia TaxID=2800373 RepID=UPI00064E4DCA|nr:hypothetical protein [Priestia aryabhattai]KML29952.1 hypothetical protein VL11_08750 [Priestia aryabhattai]KMN98944.1 hypothetical protein ABV89_14745 [Priestia aryabhattai]
MKIIEEDVAVIKICGICNDEIEDIDKAMLRRIRKGAMKFPGSKKEELKKIHTLAFKFSNEKICEYCYLREMARLTTIMRIKAMENKNS